MLQYLGRYTHRVAVSNHRLVALADGQVTFRWRDSADHNQQKLMTLARDEFLRRFLLHLLQGLRPHPPLRVPRQPKARRSAAPVLCRSPLSSPRAETKTSTAPTTHPLWRCPKCGGPMVVVERFNPAEIQLRSQSATIHRGCVPVRSSWSKICAVCSSKIR